MSRACLWRASPDLARGAVAEGCRLRRRIRPPAHLKSLAVATSSTALSQLVAFSIPLPVAIP